MARLERGSAQPPDRAADALPASPARGTLAPQAGRSSRTAAQVAAITQQLRDAGIDLSRVRRNILASTQGHPVNFERQAMSVLLHHFPNVLEVGLSGNRLAAALLDHLARETSESRGASSSRAAQAAPARSPARSAPTPESRAGSSTRAAQAAPPRSPARAAQTPQPAPPSAHEAQAASIVAELRNAGFDLRGFHRDFSTLVHRRQISMHRRALGILQQHFPAMREYAEISESDPLAAALERALEHATLGGQISAAFNDLRSISKDDAERMGFKDAATHSADEATHCMFGGPLSTSDPAQRVIGLVPMPSDPAEAAFSADVNKEPVFMDLAKLAQYLETKSLHPVTRQPLDASNIRDYAFRIE
jgi:hypothetical protein